MSNALNLCLLLLDEQREHLSLGEYLKEASDAPRPHYLDEGLSIKLETTVVIGGEVVGVVAAGLNEEVDEDLGDGFVFGLLI